MRLTTGILIVLAVATASFCAAAGQLGRGVGGHYVAGEVLVRPAAGTTIEVIARSHGLTISGRLDALDWYRLELPQDRSVPNAVAWMSRDPRVQWVIPNYEGQTPETDQIIHAFIDGTPTVGEYQDQSPFQRIKGPEAWAYRSGQPTLVAVLDTGVDLDHPALAGHIAADGFDFVARDAVPEDQLDGIDEDLDGEIDEGAGHGTHIAGIITLVHPEAIILPVRVLNSDGVGNVFDVAEGIVYAVQHGAPIINLSLGESTPPALEAAVAYAIAAGANVVASAGNRNSERPQYPAAYPGVISVAATDDERLKAEFSNFGESVDVAAQGRDLQHSSAAVLRGGAGHRSRRHSSDGQSALLMAVDLTLTPQGTNPFILATPRPRTQLRPRCRRDRPARRRGSRRRGRLTRCGDQDGAIRTAGCGAASVAASGASGTRSRASRALPAGCLSYRPPLSIS
ncbi:MAG: S8 family serine peptidase [Planctomycetota bacterium]